MLATELVGDVARRLGEVGIEVMPVKGALLQHWLYDDPSERPLTDVDLVVRPENLHRAIERLETAGYRRTPHRSVGGRVLHTPFGLALDLHPRLFDRARYRVSTRDLFARSTENHDLYGASVRTPSPLDVYAHLVGKFGSDHLGRPATARLDEIARLGLRIEVRPDTMARHLQHCGMRRVSRYVLPLVHEVTGDAFSSAVSDDLAPDPLGRGIAKVADSILGRTAADSGIAAVFAHLLNDSVPRGVRSGVRAMLHRSE